MGKKNKRRHSNHKISKHVDKKKWQRLAQNKIEKIKNELLNSMHNLSNVSFQQNSVIVLDDTVQIPCSPCNIPDSNIAMRNKSLKNGDMEPVIIPEDDDVLIINNGLRNSLTPRRKFIRSPVNCSTPIAKPKEDISKNNNTETAENQNFDIGNFTKEINRDSYLTIDLTTETRNDTNSQLNTVIDLDNTDTQDCTVVSVSNTSLSMSGDSNVTVLHNPRRIKKSESNNISAFVNGIANLNASEKGKLLDMITQKIFSGCKVPSKRKSNTSITKETVNKTNDSIQDRYIKEVILGGKQSRNSIGSNIYNPEGEQKQQTGLRMIVIDGSNVAMEHSKGHWFSVKGLKICIDYFLKRGHVVKAFVPRFRCKRGKSSLPRLLDDLERQGLVIYTPSREIQGKMITSYDDRYIVQCAAEFDGVIVSCDNYRDLLKENPRWRYVIENRLLQFTWVNDMIMFPKDPLGRFGPPLEKFLRHSSTTNIN